uniref:FI04491p n=1 Tax=Drosophila melanogaster TaxID=7227 RepID=C5WLP2_DROME|nr:FI04491p [Drosophila melanogaster]
MAFLCPVRMRRDKKKATNASIERDLPAVGVLGMGRITGSSSIETLVRVGIEKEHGLSPDSKMVVLHDFTPCVDDELEVKRGQLVNILYRENDWVYVIGQDSRQEGFIPLLLLCSLQHATGRIWLLRRNCQGNSVQSSRSKRIYHFWARITSWMFFAMKP